MKKQFLSLVRWSWNGADTLRKVLHLVVLLSIFSIIINAIFASTPKVPGSAALVIRPTGRLVEQLSGDPFSRALAELTGDAEPQTLVSDIIEGLRSAKDDARITSVMLDLSEMPGGGLSKLKRVAGALVDEWEHFGVDYALAGRHPLDVPLSEPCCCTKRIGMIDIAPACQCDGLETAMRMRGEAGNVVIRIVGLKKIEQQEWIEMVYFR